MEDYAAAKAVHVLASLHVADDPAGAFEVDWLATDTPYV